MLTRIEMKMLDRIYSTCCKFFTVPFTWRNRKVSMKHKKWRLHNTITWFLLLTTFGVKVRSVFFALENQDIDGSILQALFAIASGSQILFKLNIWIYEEELIRIIQQVFYINSCWGKYCSVTVTGRAQHI